MALPIPAVKNRSALHGMNPSNPALIVVGVSADADATVTRPENEGHAGKKVMALGAAAVVAVVSPAKWRLETRNCPWKVHCAKRVSKTYCTVNFVAPIATWRNRVTLVFPFLPPSPHWPRAGRRVGFWDPISLLRAKSDKETEPNSAECFAHRSKRPDKRGRPLGVDWKSACWHAAFEPHSA